jgi:type IV secretory pathway VirB10-like protein
VTPQVHGRFLDRFGLKILGVVVLGLIVCIVYLTMKSRRAQAPVLSNHTAPDERLKSAPADLTAASKTDYATRMQNGQEAAVDRQDYAKILEELAQMRKEREQEKWEREQLLAGLQTGKDAAHPPTVQSTPTPTLGAKPVDPDAQKRTQDAREAEKAAREALKAARHSPIAAMREDGEQSKPKGGVEPPASPYTVSSGTTVPCTLDMAINSERQKVIIGKVRSPVYDSVTGEHVVIPPDSTLTGDPGRVVVGDETIDIVWDLLTYPDGSEAKLDGQPGGDTSGMGGLQGDVDNKWGTILISTVAKSAFQASGSLASASSGSSAGGRAASAGMQSMVQDAGSEVTKTFNLAPTITVAPALPCTMTVKKALNLQPWTTTRR